MCDQERGTPSAKQQAMIRYSQYIQTLNLGLGLLQYSSQFPYFSAFSWRFASRVRSSEISGNILWNFSGNFRKNSGKNSLKFHESINYKVVSLTYNVLKTTKLTYPSRMLTLRPTRYTRSSVSVHHLHSTISHIRQSRPQSLHQLLSYQTGIPWHHISEHQ